MTRVLASLEQLGLIVRTPHARDGRQHLVSLTKAAQDLLREDKRRREAWLAQRLAELTVEERELLAAAAPIIDRITAHVSPTFRSLRIRNYRLYATGALISNIGTWMQRIAQDWLVLELTDNNGIALGITTGLQFLPMLLVGPWAGCSPTATPSASCCMLTQAFMGVVGARPRPARSSPAS